VATAQSVAATYYRQQAAIAKRTARAIQSWWREVDIAAIGASWAAIQPNAVQVVTAGQVLAAASASAYVLAQGAAQGFDAGMVGTTDPAAFAGTTASGITLEAAMGSVIASTGQAITAGAPPSESLLSAGMRMVNLALSEVQQAGSNATHASITMATNVTGYVRMLQTPSCPRCVILAGRVYRWSDGFQRHPRCDCVHVPYAEAAGVEDVRTNPQGYFDSLSAQEQDRIFGQANAQAIRDGADMNQVVNISRKKGSLYSFDLENGTRLQATNEGTTIRQGRAGRTMAIPGRTGDGALRGPGYLERAGQARLTPRSIYQLAGDDRELAQALLSRYGYVRSGWTPDFDRSSKSLLRDMGFPADIWTRAGNR